MQYVKLPLFIIVQDLSTRTSLTATNANNHTTCSHKTKCMDIHTGLCLSHNEQIGKKKKKKI